MMESNRIIGVKWSDLCLHLNNDRRPLKRQNEGKNVFDCYNQCHAYFRATTIGPIDFNVCLHATLFFSKLSTYTPKMVWRRSNETCTFQ